MKPIIAVGLISLSMQANAQNLCGGYFDDALVRGFRSDRAVVEEARRIVSESEVRPQIDSIKGFNNTVIQRAPRIEKLVRQETPYTVSLMGREIVQEISAIKDFSQMGYVYGDPHFGNSNAQPNVFRGKAIDRNRYGVVDLDEVTVGIYSLDLARFSIFLKASYGNLNKKFGAGFDNEFFKNYQRGLTQDRSVKVPAFIQKSLDATPEKIRSKVDKYAKSRTEADGTFKKKLIADGELQEFSTKNMKPEFLKKMGFNRDKQDRKDFKGELLKVMTAAAQADLGENIKIIDVAIPLRDSGGSATLQRFLLSTEVDFAGTKYRTVIEFKENSDMAAWDAVISTPFQSAAQRYEMALKVTTDDGGPLLKVVEFTPAVSFLMRPKGNLDIEFKTDAEIRELALFNAYTMGLFHGGQQTEASKGYVKAVTEKLNAFQAVVIEVSEKVLQKLSVKSGLKIPKD